MLSELVILLIIPTKRTLGVPVTDSCVTGVISNFVISNIQSYVLSNLKKKI